MATLLVFTAPYLVLVASWALERYAQRRCGRDWLDKDARL